MSTTLRLALGAILVAASASAHSIDTPSDYLCGTGTIEEVIEGGWSWEGLHLTVDWEGAGPAGALEPGRQSTVRVLASNVGTERLKVLRAAAWLAFANEFRVKFVTGEKNSAGEVDCGRIREIHLMK